MILSRYSWAVRPLPQDLGVWCKKSIKLGHTDTITLKRCMIGMEKNNLFQMETLSA